MWSCLHSSPANSVEIFKDVRAKKALGMHWGQYSSLICGGSVLTMISLYSFHSCRLVLSWLSYLVGLEIPRLDNGDGSFDPLRVLNFTLGPLVNDGNSTAPLRLSASTVSLSLGWLRRVAVLGLLNQPRCSPGSRPFPNSIVYSSIASLQVPGC
jgi:hypothetical protein